MGSTTSMSRNPTYKSLLVVGIAVSLLMTACGSASAKVVKIAISFPQGIDVGKGMLRAAQLAISEANGKAGPYSIDVLISSSSDPKGSPVSNDMEAANAKQAIADPSVVAYIGGATSDQARAVLALLNNANMTQVSATATWPGLTKPGFGAGEPGIYYPTGRRHFFRLVPSDDVQGLVATRWVHQLGAKSVYIVSDGSAYGEGLAGIFEANAPDQSLQVLGHDRYDSAKIQPAALNDLAAKIIAANPDALYYPAAVGDTKLMVEVRTLNPKIMLVSGDALTSQPIGPEAQALEGLYATNVAFDPSQLDTASQFRTSFQTAYGKPAAAYDMLVYESTKALLQAISQADAPTRDSVLTAMSKLGEVNGVLGKWHFDTNGDINLTQINGMQLVSGQWKSIAVIHS